MIAQSHQQGNRLWFDFYTNELNNSPKTGHKMFDEYFLCPCCHFPTLTERQAFEICLLCNWEDDGQDDHNADKILGGPNQDYSLSEARQNFIKYLTSYRPTDKYHFERTTVKKSDGKTVYDLVELKKTIIEKYNSALTNKNADERKQIFKVISELERQLNS